MFGRGRRREIREQFAGRVSPEILDRIAADPDRLPLDGERVELTVLFCDLRGFNALAEGMTPHEAAQLLREHLASMSALVLEHGGTIDKFMGDCLMAFFGAPVPADDHASRACASALAMSAAVRRSPLSIGIGINTGSMTVGNLGTPALFDYTVLGEAVAAGSRLERMTASYGVSILAGDRTEAHARGRFTFREVDAPPVFELFGDAAARSSGKGFLLTYADALAAFREGDRERARDLFSQAERLRPGDGPCRLYLSRCG